jgi:adhesin transport system outer membrane protein
MPKPSTHRFLPLPPLLLLATLALCRPAWAGCVDEDRFEQASPLPISKPAATPGAAPNATPAEPRGQLLTLVRDALARSQGIGAAKLLAEAALQDVEEAKASKKPQASLTGSVAPALLAGSNASTSSTGSQLQASAGVQLSQTLFDAGRADRVVDWRRQQAEAARLGMLSTQEQITLSTTSLAFERSRFRMQAIIYGQNVRKMGCLVEALETIVAVDKGRSSELVQARKQMLQAELQQAQAVSQARQVEAKLRRIAGDGLPAIDGISTLLLAVPELPEVLSAAERSTDIGAMDANAAAMREMARAVEASTRPQVGWNVGGSAALTGGGAGGGTRNGSLSAGLTINIPLLNPAIDYSVQAARKRAEAAVLQRSDALEARRQRIVESHEQASSAFDRLRRVSLVLRESERLRNFTLQQWQQLGRRSLFDVIAAESDHYNLRVQYVNTLHDGQQMNATLLSLGIGLAAWLQ